MQTFVCGVCDTFVSLSSLSLLSIILFDVTLFSFQGTTLNMSFLSVFSDFRLSSDGGDEENRTPDPLLARQVLSQLSYTPRDILSYPYLGNLVGLSGLEPPTSRLSGVRSNRLSYRPMQGIMGSLSSLRLTTLCCSHILIFFFSMSNFRWTLENKQHSFLSTYRNLTKLMALSVLLRKEVIQPHLPIRLPCYDFTPITNPTFDCCLLAVSSQASGVIDSHGVTGGVYKARERIHRDILIRDY